MNRRISIGKKKATILIHVRDFAVFVEASERKRRTGDADRAASALVGTGDGAAARGTNSGGSECKDAAGAGARRVGAGRITG